jgi:hypothetical protein
MHRRLGEWNIHRRDVPAQPAWQQFYCNLATKLDVAILYLCVGAVQAAQYASVLFPMALYHGRVGIVHPIFLFPECHLKVSNKAGVGSRERTIGRLSCSS